MAMDKKEEEFVERDYLSILRESIEEQYNSNPNIVPESTGCFGSILCYELHENGLTFLWLAEKWGIPVSILGSLIKDHCDRLHEMPKVNHGYKIK